MREDGARGRVRAEQRSSAGAGADLSADLRRTSDERTEFRLSRWAGELVDKPSAARHMARPTDIEKHLCPGGGIGRRTSFRCWRSQGRGGSSPLLGTIALFANVRDRLKNRQKSATF